MSFFSFSLSLSFLFSFLFRFFLSPLPFSLLFLSFLFPLPFPFLFLFLFLPFSFSFSFLFLSLSFSFNPPKYITDASTWRNQHSWSSTWGIAIWKGPIAKLSFLHFMKTNVQRIHILVFGSFDDCSHLSDSDPTGEQLLCPSCHLLPVHRWCFVVPWWLLLPSMISMQTCQHPKTTENTYQKHSKAFKSFIPQWSCYANHSLAKGWCTEPEQSLPSYPNLATVPLPCKGFLDAVGPDCSIGRNHQQAHV